MTAETIAPAQAAPRGARTARAFWVRQILTWHWMSAAISLVGMLAFAVTGVTLNHAGDIAAAPIVRSDNATLPPSLQQSLAAAATPSDARAPLPADLAVWADQRFALATAGRDAEWSPDEIYLAIARPGGDSWISIDRASGDVAYEDTWRGWIAYFNDLHKGRNTGGAWAWFIDIFAVACVVFCLTGLGLLWLKAAPRPSTWPLVGAGVMIPLLLALFFLH